MNCLKKRAMLVTASFLGIGGYLLYQNLKNKIDSLEEEIWDMKDYEFESYPYCDRVYSIEAEKDNHLSEDLDKTKKVRCENCNNELHDEVQNYLEHAEQRNKYNKIQN